MIAYEEKKHLISFVLACYLLSTTTEILADSMKDELISFTTAALNYVASGYQLTYLTQTECGKYAYKSSFDALELSKRDVGVMWHGDMFTDLQKSVEAMFPDLRKEVDAKITKITPLKCGFVEGALSGQFKRYQNEWFGAIKTFNQVKKEQELIK
jgi:hypothetical protein